LWLRLETAPETISNDEVQVLFKASYDELASLPCAQRLLVRIASFPALEASFEALRAGEKIDEFFPAKEKLTLLGLLDAAGPDRLSQHPLLAEHGNPALDQKLVVSERRYAEQWLEAYAKANRRNYPRLEKEQDNLLGLLEDLAHGEDLLFWFAAHAAPRRTGKAPGRYLLAAYRCQVRDRASIKKRA
jgi:hypothetical protein